jgi:FSR family fosmidomycin resistance protein-like MFS transporter
MLYQVGAVIGGFIGGWASDRLGRARVIWTSIMLSTPFLLGSLFETGLMMYMLLFIGGFMNMASNSVSIALAQELVPDNAGTASSFPMGFSWGIAGLGVMICGGVAERVGVESTMIMLSLLPILAGLLALMLPRDPGRRRASAPPVNAPVPETQTA